MNRTFLGVIVAIALSFALVACGDDDSGPSGGPIDGAWELTATTCDGAAGGFPPYVITINNTSGTFVFTFGADCVATFDESYSYSNGEILITPNSVSCNPDAGCAGAGVDCANAPPPVTYSYAKVGSNLTFSKISVGPPGDPCPVGEEVKFLMAPK